MGRSKLPDFDAERPPELSGLPIFSAIASSVPEPNMALFSVELAFGERSRSRLKVDCHPLVNTAGNCSQALVAGSDKVTLAVNEAGLTAPRVVSAGIVLPRGSVLRDGVWLLGEGRALKVIAADEDLLEVSVIGEENAHLALLKAAYHLGNRHVALEISSKLLKLQYDYVLADMLVAMGLKVKRRFGPFEPEWGAYASGHHH